MKFSKLASATTGFMMKMIDNKSTRLVYRFGGRTKTFAQEASLDRILFRTRIDPNWNAAFGRGYKMICVNSHQIILYPRIMKHYAVSPFLPSSLF